MALFFAQSRTWSCPQSDPRRKARRPEPTAPSGELGGVFGVAVLAAVFNANGSCHSGQ